MFVEVLFYFSSLLILALVALHLVWVCVNVGQNIIYLWLGWFTCGLCLVYCLLGCLTFSMVLH